MQVGAVGGIRTLEPLSGYTISSRARYDHFDTTASLLFWSAKQQSLLYQLFGSSQALFQKKLNFLLLGLFEK